MFRRKQDAQTIATLRWELEVAGRHSDRLTKEIDRLYADNADFQRRFDLIASQVFDRLSTAQQDHLRMLFGGYKEPPIPDEGVLPGGPFGGVQWHS